MSSGDRGMGADRSIAQPALRDAVASASYDYDEALVDYQISLGSRDRAKQATAEARLHQAMRRLSLAQAAIASYRARIQRPTFDELLSDPMQQLDVDGVVMASVFDYRVAVRSTASASPAYLEAPPEARAAQYVYDISVASTVAATA